MNEKTLEEARKIIAGFLKNRKIRIKVFAGLCC